MEIREMSIDLETYSDIDITNAVHTSTLSLTILRYCSRSLREWRPR